MSLKERDFVALTQVAGSSTRRILVVHILSNLVNNVVMLVTLQVGWGMKDSTCCQANRFCTITYPG